MLSIKVDTSQIKRLTRDLDALAKKQIPFATAQALTAVARDVVDAERDNMIHTLDRPTPFTLNSVRVRGATKAKPVATVFLMDIAAQYLEPYIIGGPHKLIGKGKTWLNPKQKSLLNQYGNLSKAQLNSLRGRPDIFVGTIVTRKGEHIGGVWQRPTTGKRGSRRGKVAPNQSGHLKLLVRFGDAIPVKQNLDWYGVAKATVDRMFAKRFKEQMTRTLATARR